VLRGRIPFFPSAGENVVTAAQMLGSAACTSAALQKMQAQFRAQKILRRMLLDNRR
jgi:hypothetical protein